MLCFDFCQHCLFDRAQACIWPKGMFSQFEESNFWHKCMICPELVLHWEWSQSWTCLPGIARLGSLQIGPPPDWALSWLCFLLTGLSPDWALRSHLWHVALVFIMEHNKTLEINFVLTWSPLGFCMYSKRMWDRCCQAVNELLLRYFYQSTENLCCYIKRFSRLICTVDAPLLAWVIMLYFTIL